MLESEGPPWFPERDWECPRQKKWSNSVSVHKSRAQRCKPSHGDFICIIIVTSGSLVQITDGFSNEMASFLPQRESTYGHPPQ